MIVISYDISDDKLRARFMRIITKMGAIRIQYSVYEINNTQRIVNNLLAKIESFAKHFSADDSVIICCFFYVFFSPFIVL